MDGDPLPARLPLRVRRQLKPFSCLGGPSCLQAVWILQDTVPEAISLHHHRPYTFKGAYVHAIGCLCVDRLACFAKGRHSCTGTALPRRQHGKVHGAAEVDQSAVTPFNARDRRSLCCDAYAADRVQPQWQLGDIAAAQRPGLITLPPRAAHVNPASAVAGFGGVPASVVLRVRLDYVSVVAHTSAQVVLLAETRGARSAAPLTFSTLSWCALAFSPRVLLPK